MAVYVGGVVATWSAADSGVIFGGDGGAHRGDNVCCGLCGGLGRISNVLWVAVGL